MPYSQVHKPPDPRQIQPCYGADKLTVCDKNILKDSIFWHYVWLFMIADEHLLPTISPKLNWPTVFITIRVVQHRVAISATAELSFK